MKLIIDIDEYSFLSCKRWLKEGVAQWSEAIIANGTPIKTVTNAEEAEAYPINQEDICEPTTQGNCEWYTSDIRWTDKLSVTANGDIIDFNGRVLGHINLEIMRGVADMRKEAEND